MPVTINLIIFRNRAPDICLTANKYLDIYNYSDLLRELKLLVKFLDVDLKPTFDLRSAISKGTATDIEYGDLWHLFKVGDTVISPYDRTQAFRVVNIAGGRAPLIRKLDDPSRSSNDVGGFAVDCYSLCYDGANYVPILKHFLIRRYKGIRAIKSLEVYPLKLEQDWQARWGELESQGQQYLELTRSPFSYRVVRGETIDEPSQHLDTHVIVDITLAVNIEPEWRQVKKASVSDFTKFDERETQMPASCSHSALSEGCCGSDYVFKDLEMNYPGFASYKQHYEGLPGPRTAEELKHEDLILLPSWVHAFVLRNRQWVTVRMSDLSEVVFNNNFDELMFQTPSQKHTIVALVETHENAKAVSTQGTHSVGAGLDLVKGKGAGLIMLLHGPPGGNKLTLLDAASRPSIINTLHRSREDIDSRVRRRQDTAATIPHHLRGHRRDSHGGRAQPASQLPPGSQMGMCAGQLPFFFSSTGPPIEQAKFSHGRVVLGFLLLARVNMHLY